MNVSGPAACHNGGADVFPSNASLWCYKAAGATPAPIQAGVLRSAGRGPAIHPDWVAGISIGASIAR